MAAALRRRRPAGRELLRPRAVALGARRPAVPAGAEPPAGPGTADLPVREAVRRGAGVRRDGPHAVHEAPLPAAHGRRGRRCVPVPAAAPALAARAACRRRDRHVHLLGDPSAQLQHDGDSVPDPERHSECMGGGGWREAPAGAGLRRVSGRRLRCLPDAALHRAVLGGAPRVRSRTARDGDDRRGRAHAPARPAGTSDRSRRVAGAQRLDPRRCARRRPRLPRRAELRASRTRTRVGDHHGRREGPSPAGRGDEGVRRGAGLRAVPRLAAVHACRGSSRSTWCTAAGREWGGRSSPRRRWRSGSRRSARSCGERDT